MAANMTRWTYKQRAFALVKALLEYLDEKPELFQQKPEVRVEWISLTRLLVSREIEDKNGNLQKGTTLQDLLELMKEYQTLKSEFDPEGKTKEELAKIVDKVVRLALRKTLPNYNLLKDLRSKNSKKNGQYWEFELTLKGKDCLIQENLEYVAEKLGISSPQSESSNGIDWHETCSKMLEKQRRATSNHLIEEEGRKNIEEIYVPLAVVQKKKTDKRQRDNLSPDAGTSLYQPEYETKQRFEHDAFLSQILERGEGKSQGKQIALIGEPGAGKTTLLQSIGDWLLKRKLGFPVWISLADLVRQENVTKIETYIFDTWLKQAILPPKLTEEVRSDFYRQIEQGKVWLLLDGVDEMLGGQASCQPLVEIDRQLIGWIDDSRVVLTCRLNVWQANSNYLGNFETYRLLDFDYPQQVQQFINNWFKQDVEKGKRLKTELDRVGRGRLQDLVKNPLRLSLLCGIWQKKEGNLPETKAGLYSRYRIYIYSWKEKEFPIKPKQQDKLDLALAKLALRDINESSSRFRMKRSLVVKELGYKNFDRAKEIGWLNHVGYAAENDDQKVYAFYHATFEEYFAALAIDDWHFFLPSEHIDRPVVNEDNPEADRPYRIFESKWKEVILLWLGREDVDDELKNQFIKKLIEFDSGCGSFYHFDAYFLAAAGIAEFGDCSKADKIVKQIVKWSISYSGIVERQQVRFSEPLIAKAANSVLLETDRIRAIAICKKLLQSQDEHICLEHICLKVARILKEIDPDNPIAIAALENLHQSQDRRISFDAAFILGRIVKGPPLSQPAPEIHQSQDELISLLQSQDERICLEAARDLVKLDPGNQKAIESLSEQLADNTLDNDIRMQVAVSLGQIDPGNTEAIEFLSDQLANNTLDDYDRRAAAQSAAAAQFLWLILTEDRMPIVVAKLKNYSESNASVYKLIWQCAQVLPYPEFYRAWHGKL